MNYSIIFAGHNKTVLEYLSRRTDVDVIHCFFHMRQIERDAEAVALCEVYGLPYSVVSNNKNIVETLRSLKRADLGICAGFEILSQEVFKWPKRGFINIHPSYLPTYRGAHPFYYMFMHNEKKGGVSLHQVVKDVDAGRIYARARFPILCEDDGASLARKANDLAVALLKKYLIRIVQGEVRGIENRGGSYFPPVIGRQYIHTNMSALEIYNLVRSQTLYGGCLLEIDGRVVCIQRAMLGWRKKDARETDRILGGEKVIRLRYENNIEVVLEVAESAELKFCRADGESKL